jgi:acyl-CoA thioesterase I
VRSVPLLRVLMAPTAVAATIALAVAPARAESPRPVTIASTLAPAAAPVAPPASPACAVASERATVSSPLVRTARRLTAGLPTKIVALGSSSTYGYGATTPAQSYPSRLAEELARLRPGQSIKVVNRGLNKDEVSETLKRLERDVIAENPDLVLWQVGTNAALWHLPFRMRDLQAGLSRMKAIGSDVVLIDPQFVPATIDAPDTAGVVSLVAEAAKREQVGLFRRYDLMRHWHEVEHLPFESFVTADRLHMNDWGYDCFAKWVGAAIVKTAGPRLPTMAASPALR